MGLFGKKEVCPVCGKKIKGDVLVRIKDNVSLCRDCSAMVNMDTELIAEQTAEDMRAHLEYRQKNQDKYDRFETTSEAKAGTSLLCVDEVQELWYCTRNRKDKNPPIFSYGEIVGFQYLEDGQPVAEEEKKGVLGTLFGEKKEPVVLHSMKVRIDLNNLYTRHIDVETVAPNNEVKTGSLGYKSNRRALAKVLELLENMTGHTGESGNFAGEMPEDADLDAADACGEPLDE